ncbi:MAG: hypothetical protein AAGH99_12785 [Planctomycetota bacterium]
MSAPAITNELPLNACCHDCDYPLHGLERHVCPECGRGFDPENARSYKLIIDAAEAEIQPTLDMKMLTWLGFGLSPVVLIFVLYLIVTAA